MRIAAALLALGMACAAMAEPRVSHLSYADLEGWAGDDHAAALDVFRTSCDKLDGADWQTLCVLSDTEAAADPRAFFELFFQPVLIQDGDAPLLTGYFEPELRGSRYRSPAYPYPVYRKPAEATGTWLTRAQIEESGVLAGRGLEIAWVDDPVDLHFLQIQGSGRIVLDDGGVIRVGYGGSNGRDYSSVGARLVARGIYTEHQVSAPVIRNWVRRNPVAGRALLLENDSYVFFRVVSDLDHDEGPRGALGRAITPLRSIAVDPAFIPLGAPVWVEKEGADPLSRLMVAQDTGSAIKGAQRADLFYGSGPEAGRAAGQVRDPGRLVVLMPVQRAYAMLPDRLE